MNNQIIAILEEYFRLSWSSHLNRWKYSSIEKENNFIR